MFKVIKERLAEQNPDALLADGFEDALVGISNRFGQPPLALYDYDRCIEILMARDKMSYEDAVEFFEFNVAGSWVGENTPAFATIMKKDDTAPVY